MVRVAERDRVIAILRAHEGELKELGIATLRLFGSMARGEAGPGSDIDILLEAGPGAGLGLRFLEALERLTDETGRPVNFVFPGRLQPTLRRRIEAEAIRVF